MLDEFATLELRTPETTIFVSRSGSGPPVLLLHGFPQTHLMWCDVARAMAARFTVVCVDLRGYGRSGCPISDATHRAYSKRSMARDMVAVMEQLGFSRFSVAGHDRGGRVAYRLALDHPAQVQRLAVLDIVPTAEAWARADAKFATAFWPWSLLAQPEPLPERLIAASADAIIDGALGGWARRPTPSRRTSVPPTSRCSAIPPISTRSTRSIGQPRRAKQAPRLARVDVASIEPVRWRPASAAAFNRGVAPAPKADPRVGRSVRQFAFRNA